MKKNPIPNFKNMLADLSKELFGSFKKKIDLGQIKGRGGTNFQPAIDFYFENRDVYNGMIIFTDGEGNIPKLNGNMANILWILEGRIAYEKEISIFITIIFGHTISRILWS